MTMKNLLQTAKRGFRFYVELAKDDPTVVNELKLYLSEQESIVTDLIRRWRMLQNSGTFVMLNQKVLSISTETI